MSKDDGEVLLQELLNTEFDREEARMSQAMSPPSPFPDEPGEDSKKPVDKETHSQWALGGNGKYTPVGSTVARLPAGIYETFANPSMWGLERSTIVTDGIYHLPDMATQTILDEVKRFWNSEELYRVHKLLYKRGIILWGKPGSGKTIAIKLLMNELVERDGIVIIAQSIPLLILCLKALRRIEPKRNLIIVLEDIDEIINLNGESSVLSMLDGESSVDNLLCIASTNYPERLGARIINRPSRFDRRIFVDMPTDGARRAYLQQATNNSLTEEQLIQWVKDSYDMSIAHLRELVAAVYCLEQPYEEVIKRLKDMASQVKASDEFTKARMGFKRPSRAGTNAMESYDRMDISLCQ